MKDREKIDSEETLLNNLKYALNSDISDQILPTFYKSKISGLISSITDAIKSTEQFKNYFTDTIALFDSSMQLDGAFISFCKEKNYSFTNAITEAVSVLSYSEKDFDPFILHGCYVINISDTFKIVKSSLIYETAQNTDNISSFVIVNVADYEKYTELKAEFIKWLKQREGCVIKVIGGDDYLQEVNYNWDSLFFGEKTNLKNEIKNSIDEFLSNKEEYNKNQIPWGMSMIIEAPAGCGKTTLINTIISQYDFEPTTINYFNTDDSIINVLFKSTEAKHKNLVFIDNFDDYIDQQFITPEFLYQAIDSYSPNNGNVVLLTCRNIPEFFKDVLYNFDLCVSVNGPDYDECIENLFGQYLTAANVKDISGMFIKNELSYGCIYKLYKIFTKNHFKQSALKKKDSFIELSSILKSITKEDERTNKSKSKKIGLLNKK